MNPLHRPSAYTALRRFSILLGILIDLLALAGLAGSEQVLCAPGSPCPSPPAWPQQLSTAGLPLWLACLLLLPQHRLPRRLRPLLSTGFVLTAVLLLLISNTMAGMQGTDRLAALLLSLTALANAVLLQTNT